MIMDVNVSVGKNWEIRGEGNKGQAKKAKTKQCFVGGFCFRCTFPFKKLLQCFILNSKGKQYYSEKRRIHTKTPVGNYNCLVTKMTGLSECNAQDYYPIHGTVDFLKVLRFSFPVLVVGSRSLAHFATANTTNSNGTGNVR